MQCCCKGEPVEIMDLLASSVARTDFSTKALVVWAYCFLVNIHVMLPFFSPSLPCTHAPAQLIATISLINLLLLYDIIITQVSKVFSLVVTMTLFRPGGPILWPHANTLDPLQLFLDDAKVKNFITCFKGRYACTSGVQNSVSFQLHRKEIPRFLLQKSSAQLDR